MVNLLVRILYIDTVLRRLNFLLGNRIELPRQARDKHKYSADSQTFYLVKDDRFIAQDEVVTDITDALVNKAMWEHTL